MLSTFRAYAHKYAVRRCIVGFNANLFTTLHIRMIPMFKIRTTAFSRQFGVLISLLHANRFQIGKILFPWFSHVSIISIPSIAEKLIVEYKGAIYRE